VRRYKCNDKPTATAARFDEAEPAATDSTAMASDEFKDKSAGGTPALRKSKTPSESWPRRSQNLGVRVFFHKS